MLAHVSTMTHLTSINLEYSSGFSANGIKHLYKLPQLEFLNLQGTDISLEGVGPLTSLRLLCLNHTKVTDAGLAHWTVLSSLEVLWVKACQGVTNADMVHVGRLTGLEVLGLGGTALTDDGLQQLTALTKLIALCPPEGRWIFHDDARRRIGR
ncbi:unnamed protein product [Closterium sp. NIES-54]